jgi:hypothetical protein
VSNVGLRFTSISDCPLPPSCGHLHISEILETCKFDGICELNGCTQDALMQYLLLFGDTLSF